MNVLSDFHRNCLTRYKSDLYSEYISCDTCGFDCGLQNPKYTRVSPSGRLVLFCGKQAVKIVQLDSDHIFDSVCSCGVACRWSNVTHPGNLAPIRLGLSGACMGCRWYPSDDGMFLIAGDAKLQVWDTENSLLAFTFRDLTSAITSISAMDVNGDVVACGTNNGTVTMQSLKTGHSIAHFKKLNAARVTCVEYFDGGPNIVIASYTNNLALVWDLRRYNKPLVEVTSVNDAPKALFYGASVMGSYGLKAIEQRANQDFAAVDEMFQYMADMITESGIKRELAIPFKPISKPPVVEKPKSRQKILASSYTANPLIFSVTKPASEKINRQRFSTPEPFQGDRSRTEYATSMITSKDRLEFYLAKNGATIEVYDGRTFKFLHQVVLAKDEINCRIQMEWLNDGILALNVDSRLHFYKMPQGTCQYTCDISANLPTLASSMPYVPLINSFATLNKGLDVICSSSNGHVYRIHPGSKMSELEQRPLRRRLSILMVSEFSYPDYGGCETHIMELSTCLIKLGHKVVIVTREFKDRRGIRFLSNGIKMYHIPAKMSIKPCGLPFIVDWFPLIRNILIRENVDVVHSHQSSSRMGFDFLNVAAILGYKGVMSDHSLFCFSELGPLFINQFLCITLEYADHVVCVSNVHKENLTLRLQIDPRKISVVGNALDHSRFQVNINARPKDRIKIVALSRLTHRKGIPLLLEVIPKVLAKYPKVDFIIGGDGPLFPSLVEMIDAHYLHQRVELLGTVKPVDVPSVLQRGHIFVNSSTTEAFCIAILEAAACGLLVVATHVGGVPEILPKDMLHTTECNADSMVAAIGCAIEQLPHTDPYVMHQRVAKMYSWDRIAEKMVDVYAQAIEQPPKTLYDIIKGACSHTSVFYNFFSCYTAMVYILWFFLSKYKPSSSIDLAPDWC